MMAADRVIRWTTAGAVTGVAGVAAVASYEHAYALVRAHGEMGWTARMVPLTVDGLIYASSMVMLDSARRKVQVPALARWLLGLGIGATLAANVAHGLGHGAAGAVVAAWPAVALVTSRPIASRRYALSARSFTSGSLVRSGYGRTWPPSRADSGQGALIERPSAGDRPRTAGSLVTRCDAPPETTREDIRLIRALYRVLP
jgi:hypothetical protein